MTRTNLEKACKDFIKSLMYDEPRYCQRCSRTRTKKQITMLRNGGKEPVGYEIIWEECRHISRYDLR